MKQRIGKIILRLSHIIFTILFLSAVICGSLFLNTNPVGAVDPDPDSIVSYEYNAFQNLGEDGDIAFVMDFNAPYTVSPTYNAKDMWLFQLLPPTGDDTPIEISSVPAYSYTGHHTIASMYFSTAQVASEGIVWGSAYRLRIVGNPTYFATPTENVNMLTKSLVGNWFTATHLSSLSLLRENLLYITWLMQTSNGVTYLNSLSSGSQVLNTAGSYIMNAGFPNVNQLVPTLFQSGNQVVPITQPTATGALQTDLSLTNKLGVTITQAFTDFGEKIKISGQMVAAGWMMLCCLIIASVIFLNTENSTAALIMVIPMVILGTWMGAIPVAFLFTVGLIVVISMFYYIFIKGM